MIIAQVLKFVHPEPHSSFQFFMFLFSVAAAIVLAILNIVPILMVIIGSLNRHDCAVNSNIPVWLIVTGVVSLIRSAINFFFRFKVCLVCAYLTVERVNYATIVL